MPSIRYAPLDPVHVIPIPKSDEHWLLNQPQSIRELDWQSQSDKDIRMALFRIVAFKLRSSMIAIKSATAQRETFSAADVVDELRVVYGCKIGNTLATNMALQLIREDNSFYGYLQVYEFSTIERGIKRVSSKRANKASNKTINKPATSANSSQQLIATP